MDNKEPIAAPAEAHRMVYFSLVCPESVGRDIRGFQQWLFLRHGARAAMKSPAHITLIPPFWWPTANLDALSAHAAAFRFAPPTLKVRLEGFGHFGKRVLFVRIEDQPELQALQEAFNGHMQLLAGGNMKADDRPFHPHVTIATRDMTPAAFREAWEHFSRMDYRAAMDLDTISLMLHSSGAWNIGHSFDWSA
jgi:2'-5' RNA ligase